MAKETNSAQAKKKSEAGRGQKKKILPGEKLIMKKKKKGKIQITSKASYAD